MKNGEGCSRAEEGINVGPPERDANRKQANTMDDQYQKKKKEKLYKLTMLARIHLLFK